MHAHGEEDYCSCDAGTPQAELDDSGFEDDAMPCGCTDYHMADCPIVTGRFEYVEHYDSRFPEEDF